MYDCDKLASFWSKFPLFFSLCERPFIEQLQQLPNTISITTYVEPVLISLQILN